MGLSREITVLSPCDILCNGTCSVFIIRCIESRSNSSFIKFVSNGTLTRVSNLISIICTIVDNPKERLVTRIWTAIH